MLSLVTPTQSDAAVGATPPAGAAFVSGCEALTSSSAEILSLKSGPRVCQAVNDMLGNMKLRRWNAIEHVGGRRGKTAVLKAKDSHLPEGFVALKLVDCTDDNTRRRFKREVEHTKTLSHPNIVTCKEGPFASDDGTLMFCVLEWISGGSLEQMRKAEANKRLSEEVVVQMAVDTLKGLTAVHKQGVVHCDLKCNNIMQTSDGRFKIVDFGDATIDASFLHKVAESMRSTTGVSAEMRGTLRYMSPEQLEHRTSGFASDIWAVGVIMYRNLSGNFPFEITLTEDDQFKIGEKALTPLRNASDDIWRIISKALKKDPSERYDSAKSMLAELIPLKECVPLPPGCERHFFICKNEAPGAQAAMNIYYELCLRGYKVWISNDVEGPNKTQMNNFAGKSAVFLVYLTKGIFSSRWCRDEEMLEAVKKKRPFVALTCKKGEFKFDVDLKDEELQKAPKGFRPFGEQLFRQKECIDWSLNATIRPALIGRLLRDYERRNEIAGELYADQDFEWVAFNSDETVSPPNEEQTSGRFEGKGHGGESKSAEAQRKKAVPGALLKACKEGNLQAVREELDAEGVNVNETDEDGETPLHTACSMGHEQVVEVLLRSDKVDVNKGNKNGNTPLHTACFSGEEQVVEVLLRSDKVDVNKGDEDGYTPLYIACEYGHLNVVNALLSKDGIDVNQAETKYGWTPLHVACANGEEQVVEVLLHSIHSDKVDVNKVNGYGQTPLYIACGSGHWNVVDALLSTDRIDVNQAETNIARHMGHSNIAKILVEAGAKE